MLLRRTPEGLGPAIDGSIPVPQGLEDFVNHLDPGIPIMAPEPGWKSKGLSISAVISRSTSKKRIPRGALTLKPETSTDTGKHIGSVDLLLGDMPDGRVGIAPTDGWKSDGPTPEFVLDSLKRIWPQPEEQPDISQT